VNADPFATTAPKPKARAVTFYFQESTIACLHDAWLKACAVDPKATKSAIVEEALIAFLSRKG